MDAYNPTCVLIDINKRLRYYITKVKFKKDALIYYLWGVTMRIIKDIFEQLQATSGRFDKEQILRDNKDNKLFVEALKFLVDTYTITGISKKKMSKKLNLKLDTYTASDLSNLMDYISKNNTGRDVDIIVVQKFIAANEDCKDFIEGLMTKSLKLGVTAKTCNKIIPGLCREFNVMLAESLDKNKNKLNDNKKFILTTKLDGTRMLVVKDNGIIKPFSRQGQPIEDLIEIVGDMQKLPDGAYDGELIATGIFADSKDQFSETMKRSRIKGVKTGLKFVCYDYIEDVNNFYAGVDKTPCEKRKNKLKEIISNTNDLSHVEYLEPLYEGNDIDMIEKCSKQAVEGGEEGVMLSFANSFYSCKRSKELLKVKIFSTCDIKCIRVEEGEGRLSSTLGKIVCDYKGYELGVGSGFTDSERKSIWNNPEQIVGKVVEVQYFEELNTNGCLSVRFPVFLRIREEGKEVSYH